MEHGEARVPDGDLAHNHSAPRRGEGVMPGQSIKKLNLQKELDALLLALRTAVTNAVDGRRAMEHLARALEAIKRDETYLG